MILRTGIHRLPLQFAECIRRTPSTAGAVPLPQWWRLKNEARSGRMVGVDALGDPSCANMKQKPCGFREASAWRARRENGSVFAPRLYPSPPKCGRRFGFAENGDSRVSCFTAPKGAYDILRTNQNVTEGVRLLLLAKRKCCAFCKNSRRNRFHYCLTVFFVI